MNLRCKTLFKATGLRLGLPVVWRPLSKLPFSEKKRCPIPMALALFCLISTLPLFAPLLALGQSADAGLPKCCRRNGKHHCAMSIAEKSQLAAKDGVSQWAALGDRCPYWPASVVAGHAHETFATAAAQAIYAEISSHSAGTAQTHSKRRIARDRSLHKRGPPSQASSDPCRGLHGPAQL